MFLPPSGADFDSLTRWSLDVMQALQAAGFSVVADPSEESPAVVLYWSKEGWVASGGESAHVVLGPDPAAADVTSAVAAILGDAPAATSVLVSIPPFDVFHERITSRTQAADGSVQFVDDPLAADYLLVGRCMSQSGAVNGSDELQRRCRIRLGSSRGYDGWFGQPRTRAV